MKNKEKKSEMLEQPPLFHVQVLFFIVNEMNSDRLEAFVLTPRNFLESHVSSRNPEWFNGAFYIVFKLFLLQKIIIVAIFMTRNYKIISGKFYDFDSTNACCTENVGRRKTKTESELLLYYDMI